MARAVCTTVAIAAVLLGARTSGLAQQPVRDGAGAPVPAPAGTASIAGRVLIMIDGKPAPVRRARVTLTPDEGAARIANADADGVFRFAELPAGAYRLAADKAGFVPLVADQRRAFERPPRVEIKAGQAATGDVWMQRGAALEGQLTLAGAPVSDVIVSALRVGYDANGKRLVIVKQARTDDRGRYRVHTLPAGEYLIDAAIDSLAAGQRPVGAPGERPLTLARTYFPGTARLDNARAIQLAAGQNETNLNFAATTMPIVSVRGRVVNSGGQPVQRYALRMTLISGLPSDVRGFLQPESNEFTFPSVPPGDYWVVAATLPAAGAEQEFAAFRATVEGQDLKDVTIATQPGAAIDGAIQTDNGSPVPAGLKVIAYETLFRVPQSATGPSKATDVAVAPDGRFAISAVFGPRVVRVDGLTGQWAVKSVTLNGADITDTPFHFKQSTDPLQVRIALTTNTASISGVVADAAGKPSAGRVVLFEDSESHWAAPSRFVRMIESGADGRFQIDGLLPATYRVVAVPYLEDGAWNDIDMLRRLAAAAASVTLAERQSKTINLTLR